MSESQTEEKKYFNYYIHGIGYLNNVRTLTPPNKDPFLVVKVSALHGPEGSHSYTYFDCRVMGNAAKEIIKLCARPINTGETVFARFILSNLWVIPFVYPTGDKEGQLGSNLRADLISIQNLIINGEVIYTSPQKKNGDSPSPEPVEDVEPIDPTDPPDTPSPSGASAPPMPGTEEAA
ncbi:DUF3577 domain-containing protein [Pseudomonas vanderleydeniana]|uniref:DUF3577 domain-containing protein n=1 Tax=Pseudomonas vanderleydeniana TaxID=2745495 RepID=A0A9E6TPV1_9PSED|nr:DUF3577 domain-containing protein [Pseudomonas vanderleydeniana]QXI26234.1 DUF3577 domain-containing protein [Pseudomonas vanderleydeniana]